MSELRRLKKYPNRRLYDFERHRYVRLDDVYDLITAKYDVQVIENETSHDITRETLMQVLTLLEERGQPLFSGSFLSQLILCRERDKAGVLGQYLEECMKAFVSGADGTHPHPHADRPSTDSHSSHPGETYDPVPERGG